jgi:arginyl-tRNA synthetase
MTENPEIGDEAVFINNYVHYQLLVSKYTAIKQLIYSLLGISLSVYTCQPKKQSIKNGKCPLYKGRDKKKYLYISGIALQLEKSQNQTAMKIAGAIAKNLSASYGDVFSVQVVPPGWIYLELAHPILAVWLQNIATGSLETRRKLEKADNLVPNSKRLFGVQYAHARCCSLLQQAHREGLIQLQEVLLDTETNFEQQNLQLSNLGADVGRIFSPHPIPWLNGDGKLRCNHPAEHLLIGELIQVIDDFEFNAVKGSINWEKTALNLSQAFENFWSECRIWGKIKITSPLLAQARLGLVKVTQSVLRLLLEEKLGVFAPKEL